MNEYELTLMIISGLGVLFGFFFFYVFASFFAVSTSFVRFGC